MWKKWSWLKEGRFLLEQMGKNTHKYKPWLNTNRYRQELWIVHLEQHRLGSFSKVMRNSCVSTYYSARIFFSESLLSVTKHLLCVKAFRNVECLWGVNLWEKEQEVRLDRVLCYTMPAWPTLTSPTVLPALDCSLPRAGPWHRRKWLSLVWLLV